MKQLTKRKLISLLILLSFVTHAMAFNPKEAGVTEESTTFNNESTTIEWAFNGNATDAATMAPASAISLASFSYGNNVTVAKAASYNNITYTRFQTTALSSEATDNCNLTWRVKPTSGLTFTPTNVSANVRRFGTDGGLLDIKAINDEGQEVTLATGLIPARDKSAADDKTSTNAKYTTNFEFDIPESLATSKGFSLVAYFYNLGTGKQIGFNDVKITGKVSGTTQHVDKYTITTKTNLDDAGTTTITPNGTEFETGTELKISATKNFGYQFINWTDAKGNVVSSQEEFTYTLTASNILTANYKKIKTFALQYDVEGGANDYMVQPDVSPTLVDGKNMYEDGTKVTLTASSNDIITFTNWSDGQTSATITVTMDKDQAITAKYSACDFIAAWDFYKAGNNGRTADFYATDNDADQLVLRDIDGNTYGWLDKCYTNGQYEGRNAGVNWKSDAAIGTYYWQTKINASAFTDIKVKSGLAYNYNAYKVYQVDYSLDGTTWTKLGSINMPSAKTWVDEIFTLPTQANNQENVYIRWKADKTSDIDGTTSNNDGNAISQIYILGTAKIVDDGVAPKLVSVIPEENVTNVSANGKIVLTFNEKVKLTSNASAKIGTTNIEGIVSGKTITFAYKGLNYATTYTFILSGKSVSDLTDNILSDDITLHFTTKTKPVIEKQLYDFIVPDNGTLKDAITAATKRSNTSDRYRIFVKAGDYTLPADPTNMVTGSDGNSYPSTTTVLNSSNVSIIGEDMNNTIVTNTVPAVLSTGANPLEGIGKGDLLQITGSDTYLEDITLKSGMVDATGRNLAVQDKGDKTIYKNVTLYGYQDTWTSNNQNARYYFEDGIIRGRTDYICGKGDAFFNGVTFQNVATGGYIAVPSKPKKYGYIMKDCIIKGESSENSGNYTLGRPWGQGTPIALWINTMMISQPSAIGWNEMSGGWPAQFAEYNSQTASGTQISLNGRKTVFADTHTNVPILTAEEASNYTVKTVMGQDDDWDPTALTEQASAPENVTLQKSTLSWDDNNYTLLWAIVKNGNVIDFTTTPTYTINDASAKYAIRAANEMGGLSDATEAKVITGITDVMKSSTKSNTDVYNLVGVKVKSNYKGIVIKNGNKYIQH